MTVTIAALQMCSGTDPVRNVETMQRLVREAAAKGAVYVQTPEMTGAIQKDRAGMRAILRAGSFELLRRRDVPPKVIISEYIDIAKAFYSDDEPPLVNGVLDRLAHELRSAELPPRVQADDDEDAGGPADKTD